MNKTITYKGVTIEQSITLPNAPVDTDVPYVFLGVNENEYDILVRPLASCGCTTTGAEMRVPAGQGFKIEGVYKKTMKTGIYSKVVHVYFGKTTEGTNSEERKLTVNFTGRIG